MLSSWITMCVLSGLALVANIALCVYTLWLSKQLEQKNYHKGYIEALLENNAYVNNGYVFLKNKPSPDETPSPAPDSSSSDIQETPDVQD